MMQTIHDNWPMIASVALGISEALALIPWVKANGIISGLLNFVVSALKPKA